jgi:hypothetical protein
LNNSSCESAQYFEFSYTDPENWSFACTEIDADSPDHADNGGNEDGNPYNDPNTPDTGDGSTPNSASIDPYSLAGLIGDELEDDLGNVERAIREDIDQSRRNTQTLETAINGVETAVRDSITSSEINTDAITTSIDALGEQLAGINDSLELGACDPSQPDYYQCLETPFSNLPDHSSTESTTIGEAVTQFNARIEASQVVQAFSGMAGLISLQAAQCPVFSIDLRGTPVNEQVSTTIHCDLRETIGPLISAVMIIVYVWIAFRIFAST